MINWTKYRLAHFSIDLDMGEYTEQNGAVVFLANIRLKETGAVVQKHPVPLKKQFYENLMEQPAGADHVFKIIQKRTRDHVLGLIAAGKSGIPVSEFIDKSADL